MQPIGGPWTVVASEGSFEMIGSLNGGAHMSVAGVEMIVISSQSPGEALA